MLNATWWVLPYRRMSFFNCNECTELFVNFTKQILFVQKYFKGFQVLGLERSYFRCVMKTSSSGNVFRVTGPWCGNSPVTGEFPAQRPVTRTFDVFFDLLLNKRLNKQWWDWWYETPSYLLWRHCDVPSTVHPNVLARGCKWDSDVGHQLFA